jgi:hypothetical protein
MPFLVSYYYHVSYDYVINMATEDIMILLKMQKTSFLKLPQGLKNFELLI